MRSKRSDLSRCPGFRLEGMDVLIVERRADRCDACGCFGGRGDRSRVATDDEALALTHAASPHVVITRMNRSTHHEDLAGQDVVRTLRRKWSALCVVYLAALWPARLQRSALAAGERFLSKPVALTKIIRTVQELLAAGICQPGYTRRGESR
jgi:DNA-binding NarL/FixJ family response regulator